MIWQVVGALGVGLLTLVASVVVILAGPPLAAEWSGRTQIAKIQQAQLERQYRLYRPAGLSARPLVIDLHSARTNGFLEELATRFDAQADRLGRIVAYPDGFADGWEPYGCCHHPGVDDVAFISELISRLESSDGADPERVYVTGLSRGGMMAYRLGCELSSKLAAIAAVAGNMADENGNVRGVPCRPEHAVSALSLHGSADKVVLIRGGGRIAPLEDVTERQRELNGCDAPGAVTVYGPVLDRTWRCGGGSEVRSMFINGVGHVWPGTPFSGFPWSANASLDASQVIAEFFAAHARAAASN